MDRELLRPSLSERRGVPMPLYSPGTVMIPAFFGGPIAAAIVFGLNVDRSSRWRRDWWLVLAGVLLFASYPLVYAQLGLLGERSGRILLKAMGLGVACVYLWRHRHLQRAQVLFGVQPPEPWYAGGIATVIGFAISQILIWKINGMG